LREQILDWINMSCSATSTNAFIFNKLEALLTSERINF